MTDPTDLREQLAAFLAGELDEPAATRMQARIDHEPAVARLADQLADLLAELGQVDQVDPPEGYEQRLRAGLEARTGQRLPAPDSAALSTSGAAAATGWATAPAERLPRRPEPSDRYARLGAVLAVAAGLLVVLATVGVLVNVGTGGDSETADSMVAGEDGDEAAPAAANAGGGDEPAEFSAAGDATDAAAPEAAAAATADEVEEDAPAAAVESDDEGAAGAFADSADNSTLGRTGAADADGTATAAEEAATEAAMARQAVGPAVLDLVVEADDAGLSTLVGGDPAVQSLLGRPAAVAAELSRGHVEDLQSHEPFTDGTPAARCVAEILEQAGSPAIPAVTARIEAPDGPALAIALVGSTAGELLDTAEVWIIEPDSCDPRRVVEVE